MGNIQTVKKISKEKGISLAFVCRQIGKSHGYLAEIASRDGDVPEKMLEPVAKALGVTVEELKGQEPAQKEKPAPGEGSGLDADVEAKAHTILDKLSKLPTKQQEAFLNSLDISIDAALNMMDGNGNG